MKRVTIGCGSLRADIDVDGNVFIYYADTPDVRFLVGAPDVMNLQHLATMLITAHFNPHRST